MTAPDPRLDHATDIVRAVMGEAADALGFEVLDGLVRDAAIATWSPVACLSMITDRQVTASAARGAETGTGTSLPERGGQTSLEDSVCVVALRTDGPVRVCDARHDDRVAHLPSVTGGSLGAYLGVPLRTDGGDLVGVLCVYDATPRAWSESDERDLERLAVQVSAELRRLTTARAGAPDAALGPA